MTGSFPIRLERLRAAAVTLSLACLLLLSSPGLAADPGLISLRFSAERPVPHFQLAGPIVSGDAERLEALILRHTRCAGPACNTSDMGPRAVISLSSPGGSLAEGVALAELFRNHAIATVVEAGENCFSACALAFLGGTGTWLTGGVGQYLDRVLEPGALLGFHSPFLPAPVIAQAALDGRIEQVMTVTREATADLLATLTAFSVDRWVLDRIIRMGPEAMWTVETISDLHAIRARLPAFDPAYLGTSWFEQMSNACAALYSIHYGTPLSRLDPPLIQADLLRGRDAEGRSVLLSESLDVPYAVSGCGLPETSTRAPLEAVHLYSWNAIEDRQQVILSLINPRNGGWAHLGYRGGRGVDSILAIGSGSEQMAVLNHLLMAPEARLDRLPAAVVGALRAGRAHDLDARFPQHARRWPVELLTRSQHSRVYEGLGLIVVEQIGTAALYDALLADAEYTEIDYRWNGHNAAVRSGEDRDTGVSYYWIALRSGGQAATIRIEAPVSPGQLTQAQRDAITAIACSVELNGARLGCYR